MFNVYVFQFFIDIEVMFENVVVYYIFQFCMYEGVIFIWFNVEEFDIEIQFVIYVDISFVFDVLSINYI